ncbi:MAG: pentapeptide repeat-containing protein [Candidatus Marinimicrobia bacterium]|nr:pentapeptide repeat-containing protein [Candidatus Neomarinimicrobiota bacterium]
MRRIPVFTAETPRTTEDELYLLLREEKVEEFNARRPKNEPCDLSGLDFRGLNLRGMDLEAVDFTDSYFRQADLAGLNFNRVKLEGASIGGANISGTYLPRELSPQEIMMSVKYGTRLRYGT